MPISPESDYCLQSMLELLHVTPDIYAAAWRMQLDVDGIIDRRQRFSSTQEMHDAFEVEVHRAVLNWRDTAAGDFDKAFMAYAGLTRTEQQLNDAIGYITDVLTEAHLMATRQGNGVFSLGMEEHLLKLEELGRYDLKNRESLLEPVVIATAIQSSQRIAPWLAHLRAQWERIQDGLSLLTPDEFFDALKADEEFHRARIMEQHRALFEEGGRQMEQQNSRGLPKLLPTRDIRRARRAVAKGVKLYERLFGKKSIQAFLSGGEMYVGGALFDYQLKKTFDVVRHTMDPRCAHIPYDLTILDKQGRRLASGCVYFKDTPIIDQILALTLHVQERESEVELIWTTNLFRVTQDYYASEEMQAVKGRALMTSDVPAQGDGDVYRFGRDPFDMPPGELDRQQALRAPIKAALVPAVREALKEQAGLPLGAYEVLAMPPVPLEEVTSMGRAPAIEMLTASAGFPLLARQENLALAGFKP